MIGARCLAIAGAFISLASATALTFNLPANQKECFYAKVDQKGAKVAFYYAVSPSLPPVAPADIN